MFSVITNLLFPHERNVEVVEHQCKMGRRCDEQEAVRNPDYFVRRM